MPGSEVAELLYQFKAELMRREAAQLEHMAAYWYALERDMNDRMVALAAELAALRDAGSTLEARSIIRNQRFQSLLEQVHARMQRYVNGVALPSIEAEQLAFAGVGLQASEEVLALMLGSFQGLPIDAIEVMIGFAGDGTPLKRLLMDAYGDAADGILQGLTAGLAQGLGPVAIAQDMADKFGIGLDRMTTIARTEQLRAYRMASTQQYRDSDVVEGFKRLATKDDRTCLACLLLDGQTSNLEDELTDHPNGRCSVVPILKGGYSPEWETGKEWFEGLSEDEQRSIMGDERFDAWQDGVGLDDMVELDHSPTWGDSPAVVPVSQL